jgi:hypothetical protein
MAKRKYPMGKCNILKITELPFHSLIISKGKNEVGLS